MGTAPQVTHVLVIDRPHTDEFWEISSLRWLELRSTSETRLQERLRAARLTVPEGMSPLTDFLPSDPRFATAKQLRDEDYLTASTDLRSLTYGVVPAGFEQSIPEHGGACRLEPGHTYEVVVLGRAFGTLLFEAQ
jgi:hypothetical protein